MLGPCVFDIYNNDAEYVTLPDGSSHGSSDCPAGAVLVTGGSVGWHSNAANQGNWGGGDDNGCDAKGLCGLPYSSQGLGGGWQICFAW